MSNARLIRQKIRAGELVLGTWLQLPSPDAAEIMARLGYDFAVVDLEHGAFCRSSLPNIFRALERWNTVPFARLACATPQNIKAALDSGAQGLIFPMIEKRQQLDEAVEHALYPGGNKFPTGKRGVGFSRSNMYGLDFINQTGSTGAAQEIIIIAQIEHINALDQLDAIFSHPRLDAFLIGPYDLSASMGLTAQFSHPTFLKALALIEQKALQYSLPKGYHVVNPELTTLREKIDQGYVLIAYGIDTLFLQLGKRPE